MPAMPETRKRDVKALSKPSKKSHKGQNGSLLLIAGSKSVHGAAVFAGITASRLVDLVFFATEKENKQIAKKASPEFIVGDFSKAEGFAKKADCILIGPGLEPNPKTRKLLKEFLHGFKEKKTVLDATALRLIQLDWLHKNCLVTPHKNEFKHLFKIPATKANALKAAKKYNCIVVLKGPNDYIADGKKVFENRTGNEGMTKGGTGDILAGLIAGFAATNSLLRSAKAACYLNGFAAEWLQKQKGRMWNASDLMDILPKAKIKLEQD